MQAELARTEHGGDVGRGRRKLEQPVSTRRPMHLVLTSHRARGPWSLRKHDRVVRDVLRRMARRFAIRIYDFANVGSHLHLVLREPNRRGRGLANSPSPREWPHSSVRSIDASGAAITAAVMSCRTAGRVGARRTRLFAACALRYRSSLGGGP